MTALTIHRRPSPGTVQDAHLPAPMGGMNTVSAASAVPMSDATWTYNLIAGDRGPRTRSGWREWVTGMTGALDDVVRTVLPFTGSQKSGAGNKLFACTSTGIWDCSASTAAPSLAVTFDITAGEAGYGSGTVVATAAGRFLVYCDEENGMYVYTETTAAWAKVTQGSGAGQIDGVNPDNLVFATVWKSRLWLVERDTSKAWYLDVNSLFGTAASFDFGTRMRAGGPLVSLYSWSYDAGGGLDSLLVAVSVAGDVVAYQGTDPTSVNTFGLKGAWSVAGVPPGRRIAIDQGGDILLLSLIGVVPLSKLVAGTSSEEKGIYTTAKISNLFLSLVATRKNLLGWGIYMHPADNALLVTMPQAGSGVNLQLAMSMSTRGWGYYRDVPIHSAGVWERELYFGTEDGRLCISTGDVDGVALGNPDTYIPIDYSALTAYSNLGNARMKRVAMVRPIVVSGQTTPVLTAAARFDFDVRELPSPGAGIGNEDGTWDNGTWDDSVWSEDATYQPTLGACGSGRSIAVAIRGSAATRTTWIGTDIAFTEGGPF